MSRQQTCGMYAMNLDFKGLGFGIKCSRIDATKDCDPQRWEVRLILFNALMVKCCFTEWKCGVVLTSNVFT